MDNSENSQYQELRNQWEKILKQVGIEPNDQTIARFDNAFELRKLVGNVYPNKYVRSQISNDEDTITRLKAYGPITEIVGEMADWKKLHEGERPTPEFKDALNARLKALQTVSISGRLTTPTRGNFVHLTDGISKLQIYAKKATFALVRNDAEKTLDEESGWAAFQLLDHGDFVGVEGYLFITNTGELSVHVEKLQFLAKAMLPMPDKMHGIADAEIKQRQRYVDLIGSSLQIKTHEEIEAEKESGIKNLTTREVFERRAKLISGMRRFLEDHDYIEVETPMLTPKATGAAAKPFETHHNALDIKLYARIAPELYLKRLVVGGFEKVYELNRNFRNEGISHKHNPEFTMLEFYCAYMDVEGMMNFCEELIRQSVQQANGGLRVEYEGNEIDFSRFERVTMKQAIAKRWSEMAAGALTEAIDASWLDDPKNVSDLFEMHEFWVHVRFREYMKLEKKDRELHNILDLITPETREKWEAIRKCERRNYIESETAQKIVDLFELLCETELVQPTFIIDFPKSVSPLSKASPDDPKIAERFELFINGMEVANGFSELNDPKEQYERFVDQMSERERGDEEAMVLDEDYIRALSYGMPPAAGIGIGIDRLVMLLTNKHSIRDVILFPHMRPEKKVDE